MITLHVFTEKASVKVFFENIIPDLLPDNASFRIYDHQGKKDLENALKNTLPTISKTPGARVLITRDQDLEDCYRAKENIEKLIQNSCNCAYFIRIICRELEAWYLGDMKAIRDLLK